MKTLSEMIAVMEASKTKKIEYTHLGQGDWSSCEFPAWNWVHYDYRVKQDRPKAPKRVWIAHEHTTGQPRWLLDVPDSTLSNAAEYVELTPEVRKALGL